MVCDSRRGLTPQALRCRPFGPFLLRAAAANTTILIWSIPRGSSTRHGATFEFPFRVADWPEGEPRDEAERQRSAALGGTTRDQVIQEVQDWLTQGLKTWGAGAKAAAGYGYFEIVA